MTRIVVGIGGVDCETHVEITTPSAANALKFLRDHDHEGSSVGLVVSFEDAEMGYECLRRLQNIQEEFRRNGH